MTVSDLYDDIDFLSDSNSISYPVAQKLRNMNIVYQQMAPAIWEVYDGWEYDDSNATDLPIATTNLQDGQQDYTIPTDMQRVKRVEVLDGSGNYVLLKQMDVGDFPVATTEFLGGGGTPLYYDIVGRSIMLFPTPSVGYVTMSAGLKVYFDRDVEALTSTSDTPGLPQAFHRILSLSAALDYVKNDSDRIKLASEKRDLWSRMISFYSKRNVDGGVTIKPRGRKRHKQYE